MFSRKHSSKSVKTISTTDSSKSGAGNLSSSSSGNGGAFVMSPIDSLHTPVFARTPTSTSVTSVASFASTAGGYSRTQALDDLPGIRGVLDIFLRGKMLDAEKACKDADPQGTRLYTATGWGIIQALKGLMSFEESEIKVALEAVKHATQTASDHRRPASSLTSRLAGFVVGGFSSGVNSIRYMTAVERHAELVYAECLLEKAILGIVSSGDWLSFIKEFMNIRSATSIYQTLGLFLQTIDAEAVARGEGPIDRSVDDDFRSGVYLGTGINHLVLTLLPETVSSVVALFGYKGDRMEGLSLLSKPGGWTADSEEPGVGHEQQGLRRPMNDMVLLTFHLFLSGFTHTGVDITQARKILNYNLKLYPDGVFFLFFEGRLRIIEGRPEEAIKSYSKGVGVTEFKSLRGVADWEIAVAHMSLGEFQKSIEFWRNMQRDANWSKAIYTYSAAVCLYQVGGEENRKEAVALFAKVPSLLQRLAGKSIPMEKFVSRRSRKYENQGNRLLLPGVEMAYIFGAIQHSPTHILATRHLPLIEEALRHIESFSSKISKYEGNGVGYWDDYALALFLHGACMKLLAYPDPETIVDENAEKPTISKVDAQAKAFDSLKKVLETGPKIELDHHLVYTAHYELGKLYACTGDKEEAKRQFELITSGQPLEVNPATRKGGKYSLENALRVRAFAAIEAIQLGRPL